MENKKHQNLQGNTSILVFFRIIAHSKILIISVALSISVLVFIVSEPTPTNPPLIFTSSSLVKIGYFADEYEDQILLDDPIKLQKELGVEFYTMSAGPSISIKDNGAVIQIDYLSKSQNDSTIGVQNVINYIINKHDNIISNKKQSANDRLIVLNQEESFALLSTQRQIDYISNEEIPFNNDLKKNQVEAVQDTINHINNILLTSIEEKNNNSVLLMQREIAYLLENETMLLKEKTNLIENIIYQDNQFLIQSNSELDANVKATIMQRIHINQMKIIELEEAEAVKAQRVIELQEATKTIDLELSENRNNLISELITLEASKSRIESSHNETILKLNERLLFLEDSLVKTKFKYSQLKNSIQWILKDIYKNSSIIGEIRTSSEIQNKIVSKYLLTLIAFISTLILMSFLVLFFNILRRDEDTANG